MKNLASGCFISDIQDVQGLVEGRGNHKDSDLHSNPWLETFSWCVTNCLMNFCNFFMHYLHISKRLFSISLCNIVIWIKWDKKDFSQFISMRWNLCMCLFKWTIIATYSILYIENILLSTSARNYEFHCLKNYCKIKFQESKV